MGRLRDLLNGKVAEAPAPVAPAAPEPVAAPSVEATPVAEPETPIAAAPLAEELEPTE